MSLVYLDGLYVTSSALHVKFAQLSLPTHKPYHILKIEAKDLDPVLSISPVISPHRYRDLSGQ